MQRNTAYLINIIVRSSVPNSVPNSVPTKIWDRRSRIWPQNKKQTRVRAWFYSKSKFVLKILMKRKVFIFAMHAFEIIVQRVYTE